MASSSGDAFEPSAPGAFRREPPGTLAARAVLGLGLRRMRLYRGWTQETLQDRSGVDQSILSRLELGRVVQIRLRRLLDVLGTLDVGEVILVPANAPAPTSSVDELYERGRWVNADTIARREIEAILSRRRSA
jgi:transcriptional regulator with XRE-family HTH domain